MWQPEPGWQRLPGAGPATVGVWSATHQRPRRRRQAAAPARAAGRARRPRPGRRQLLATCCRRRAQRGGRPAHRACGRRPSCASTRTTRASPWSTNGSRTTTPPGLWLAACLGRFAAADLGEHPWLARDQLRSRLAPRRAARRLAHPGPHAHGRHRRPPVDAPRRRGSTSATPSRRWPSTATRRPPTSRVGTSDGAVAIDWAHLGRGPVGADLGYLSLATREDVEPLVEAYVAALPAGLARPRTW